MIKQFNAVRAIAVALLCFVVAACSQTAYSTHAGHGKHGSKKVVKGADYRKAKIQASRARAKKAREARRKAFIKSRADRRAARIARSGKSAKKSGLKRSKRANRKAKRSASKKRRVNRKARRSASKKRRATRKARNRKVAKRNTRRKATRIASAGKKRRIKKRTSAFVPNVGRRGGITFRAPWKCVPKRLKIVIGQIRKRWGRVTINSTWRSRKHNRRVGGKRNSYHLHCNAVDFRVHGSSRGLTRWLRRHRLVGGYNRYPSGYYHIDTGPKRTW